MFKNLIPIHITSEDGKRHLDIEENIAGGISLIFEAPHFQKIRVPIGCELWNKLVNIIKEQG